MIRNKPLWVLMFLLLSSLIIAVDQCGDECIIGDNESDITTLSNLSYIPNNYCYKETENTCTIRFHNFIKEIPLNKTLTLGKQDKESKGIMEINFSAIDDNTPINTISIKPAQSFVPAENCVVNIARSNININQLKFFDNNNNYKALCIGDNKTSIMLKEFDFTDYNGPALYAGTGSWTVLVDPKFNETVTNPISFKEGTKKGVVVLMGSNIEPFCTKIGGTMTNGTTCTTESNAKIIPFSSLSDDIAAQVNNLYEVLTKVKAFTGGTCSDSNAFWAYGICLCKKDFMQDDTVSVLKCIPCPFETHQIVKGGACICDSASDYGKQNEQCVKCSELSMIAKDGICIACAPDEMFENGQCIKCASPRVMKDGTCRCPEEDSVYDSTTKICSENCEDPNAIKENGVCVCDKANGYAKYLGKSDARCAECGTNGQIMVTGTCKCKTKDSFLVNLKGECVAATGENLCDKQDANSLLDHDLNACVCKDGYRWSTGAPTGEYAPYCVKCEEDDADVECQGIKMDCSLPENKTAVSCDCALDVNKEAAWCATPDTVMGGDCGCNFGAVTTSTLQVILPYLMGLAGTTGLVIWRRRKLR